MLRILWKVQNADTDCKQNNYHWKRWNNFEVITEDYRKVYQPAIDINQLDFEFIETKIDMRGSSYFNSKRTNGCVLAKMLQVQEKTDKISETILLKDL